MAPVNNVTKIRICKPARDVFECFVDPTRIGKFWFSSSSGRWEEGKTITLRYEEYGAEGAIRVVEVLPHRRIAFQWGYEGEGHLTTINLVEENGRGTVVEVSEEGFAEDDPRLLENMLDNKGGWVYTLTCLKGYLEYGADLRASLIR